MHEVAPETLLKLPASHSIQIAAPESLKKQAQTLFTTSKATAFLVKQ